jgi:hypothetical protein
VDVAGGHRHGDRVTTDLSPMPPVMHVGALLLHVMNALTSALPSPLAFTTEGSRVLLLDGQRVRSSSHVDVPDEVADLPALLADRAHYILDEAQDLAMSVTGQVWPSGAPAHPAAGWTADGSLRLGYFPQGDLSREPVLAVPDYRPPSGRPRVAG